MARPPKQEQTKDEAAIPRTALDRTKRLIKFFLGLLLLPACWAMTLSLFDLIAPFGADGFAGVPRSVWWFLGGFVFWVFLFFVLPLPVRSYVLAHELTHALWAALVFGVPVKGISVKEGGGHVKLTRINTWISLAPYFFPLYTVIAMLAYLILNAFWDLSPYEPFWMATVGLTWSFHLTFTLRTLHGRQTDILAHGHVFSYVVIYLMNLLFLAFFIIGVMEPTFRAFLDGLVEHANHTYSSFGRWIGSGIERF